MRYPEPQLPVLLGSDVSLSSTHVCRTSLTPPSQDNMDAVVRLDDAQSNLISLIIFLSRSYSGTDEIEAYAHEVAEKHDLRKYFRLEHKVVYSAWNEATSMWDVQIQQPDGTILHDSAHVLINGSGVLKCGFGTAQAGVADVASR